MRKALILDPLYPQYSRWLGRFPAVSPGTTGRDRAGPEDDGAQRGLLSPRISTSARRLSGAGDAGAGPGVVSAGPGLDSSVRSYDAFIVRALAPTRTAGGSR